MLYDIWKNRKRGPQSLMLKDIGYIIARVLPEKDWTIVEIGPGSGSLTMYLAYLVYPNKIIVYEKDDRWIPILKENLSKANLDNVIIKKREIGLENIDEEADLIIIDVKNVIDVVKKVKDKAKKYLVIFVIHFEKLSQLIDILDGFNTEIVWLEEHRVTKTPNGTRFEISGVKFNGFIVIAERTKPS